MAPGEQDHRRLGLLRREENEALRHPRTGGDVDDALGDFGVAGLGEGADRQDACEG